MEHLDPRVLRSLVTCRTPIMRSRAGLTSERAQDDDTAVRTQARAAGVGEPWRLEVEKLLAVGNGSNITY